MASAFAIAHRGLELAEQRALVADARRRGPIGRARRYPGIPAGATRAPDRVFGEIAKQKQVKPN